MTPKPISCVPYVACTSLNSEYNSLSDERSPLIALDELTRLIADNAFRDDKTAIVIDDAL